MDNAATACLQPLISPFNACLTPVNEALKDTVSSSINLHKNRSSLSDSLRQLEAFAETLKRNVEEEAFAEMRLCNADVREWHKRVDEAVIRAKPLLAEYNPTDSGSQPSTCIHYKLNPFRCLRLSRKVTGALQNVNGLLIQGRLFTPPFTLPPLPEAVRLMPILKPTFGIDGVMHQVWSQFNKENISIVGLYGLGGVGKTTLLKSINNKLRQRNDGYQFQVVIMLEVANSETLNVAGMQRIISNRLGLPWNKDESDNDRAAFLLEALAKKKFVVLLDDVRQKFELELVGIPTPISQGNGSKLIVVSRGESVCANMGAKNPIKVHCLQEDEAWILFLSKLTDNVKAFIQGDKDMKKCAEEIVKSCGGLPLAIDVIGSALAVSLAPIEWNEAATAMKQNPTCIEGVEDMLTILKYSYDMLNDTHKECFLYCTMFPDYGSISMQQLVEYWLAEKLISSERPYEGYSIINNLLTACLLQRSDSKPGSEVKMHQMIRIIRHQQFAEKKLLIKAGEALEQAPDAMEWEEATRISLMFNDIKNLSIFPKCKKLLTLLLQNNTNLSQLSSNFFYFMSALKVLDLSHTAISELPDCSKLVQLVYLNLSHTLIKELPKQFCSALVQLQYLNMSHTLITKLPQQLAKLMKLTHLNLGETSELAVIPHGTISKLFTLKVLNLYKSKYGVQDLPDLNLEELQRLESLGITIHSQEVFGKLRKSDPLARCTCFLSLSLCLGMKYIQLSEFKTMSHLTELHIESCNELEELIVDSVDEEDSAKKVKVLTLANLPNFAEVSCKPVIHQFENLRDLTIHKCPKLENVSWVLLLESLERLVITECHGLKQIIHGEIEPAYERELSEITPVAGGRNMPPRLRIMELKHLNVLERIGTTREFPCLESITVHKCLNLTQLPVRNMYPKLKQICGERSWWETVAGATKANYGDIFVPI